MIEFFAFVGGILGLVVAGFPIVFLILGTVEVLKRLRRPDGSPRLKGDSLLWSSIASGVVYGAVFRIYANIPPPWVPWFPAFRYWVEVLFFGAGMGLIASGLFEVIKGVIERTFAKIVSIRASPAGAASPTLGEDILRLIDSKTE